MSSTPTKAGPDHEVVVIGAGPGGIAAGAKLKKAGVTDFVILDRADGPGGTWQHYTYPGISVDTPVLFYQFTFEPDPTWPRLFPSGAELQNYHMKVAKKYGLEPHFRVNREVKREVWDDRNHFWRLHMADGTEITTRFVISGVGAFVTPKDAPFPGLENYRGFIQRPGRWDNSFDHRGLRVGVIGTGASAVQIIPKVAQDVEQLTVFQRTPPWCLPRPNVPLWPIRPLMYTPGLVTMLRRSALAVLDIASRRVMHWEPSETLTVPAMRTFDRGASVLYRAYLFAMVRNRKARKALMPNYGPLTKRPTANSQFLPAFNRKNVELSTDPVSHFTENGVVTKSGDTHEFDMVIMATGHEMYSEPMDWRIGQIVGRDGFDLATFWRDNGMQAYDSCSVPGVPNRFMLSGPYSWYAIDWHEIVERGADHAVRAITLAKQRGATMMEVRKEVADAFHAEQYAAVAKVRPYFNVVNSHANTYYRNSHGDFPFPMLGGVFAAEHRANNFPAEVYEYSTVGAARRPAEIAS